MDYSLRPRRRPLAVRVTVLVIALVIGGAAAVKLWKKLRGPQLVDTRIALR